MANLMEILFKPFTQLRSEEQLVVASMVLCSIVLVIWSVAFAVRTVRPRRLRKRRPVGRPVVLTWRDRVGLQQSDDGFCQNVSTGGLALELPFPLKTHTRINFRVSEVDLYGTGIVCRCNRIGSRYAVGVKVDPLTQPLSSFRLDQA